MITKQANPDPWDTWSVIAAFWTHWVQVKRHCSEFLRFNAALYHGTDQDWSSIHVGHTPHERYPQLGERREEIDAWLVQHGFVALRGNSMFCGNRRDMSVPYAKYGKLYIVFPVNGFRYTWYRNTDDLFVEDNRQSRKGRRIDVDKLMQIAQPADTDLSEALNSHMHHEIQLLGNFWAFDAHIYGDLIMDEMYGNGLQKSARWMPPESRERLQAIFAASKSRRRSQSVA